MSVNIPVRCFAIAADAAARKFGERVADVFDASKPSRARLIAIEALVELYPAAPQIGVAECFGWLDGGRALKAALARARCSAWRRRADVDSVFAEVRASLRDIVAADIVTGDEPVQRLAEDERRAAVFEPRVYRPTRLAPPAPRRGANITAAICGDPPKGRRDYLAALSSPGYCAGKEDRQRRPREEAHDRI